MSLFVAPVAFAEDLPCMAPDFVAGSLRADLVRRHLGRGQAVHILAIGSSSTEGVGASSKDASYPARLEADLRVAWPGRPVYVENAGVGGEVVGTTLDRLEARLTAAPYDLVIWQVGTNDALGSSDTTAFRAMLKRGIAAARAARTEIVLLDPQFFPGIKDPATYEAYVAAVAATGREENVPVMRRYDLMKAWAQQGPGTLLSALSRDRFHMGDAGYACLARLVAGRIAASAGTPGAVPMAGAVPGGPFGPPGI